MDKPSPIEFNVDEQYENEKGVFTVVSMERDEMVIRWENGEETRTDIDLQRRIIERREREAVLRAQKAEAAAKPSRSKENRPFSGLNAADFKNNATGTRWRARQQLGGAIVRQMGASGFKFNSWAFGNQPEMHVQDARQRSKGNPETQAKFFVSVDPGALYYGFQVPRPGGAENPSGDWERVMAWLSQEENDTMLHSLAAEDHLRIEDPHNPAAGTLEASEKGWQRVAGTATETVASIAALIRQAPDTAPGTLRISAVVARDQAVDRGPEIAEHVAQLFTRLLPLYRAAVPE
jgi:hypothetical protein